MARNFSQGPQSYNILGENQHIILPILYSNPYFLVGNIQQGWGFHTWIFKELAWFGVFWIIHLIQVNRIPTRASNLVDYTFLTMAL